MFIHEKCQNKISFWFNDKKNKLDYKWAPSWPRLMQRQWKRLKVNPRYGENETFYEMKVRLLVNFKNALELYYHYCSWKYCFQKKNWQVIFNEINML